MSQHFLLSKKVRDFSLIDIMQISTELDALKFLAQIRWGSFKEQVCSDCGVIDSHYFRPKYKQWRCKHCEHVFSVTSRTLFHSRKIKLRKLLLAIFLFSTSSKGMSASALSRKIGICHNSALILMHKLREGIVQHQDLTSLSGKVEIDGTYVGGKPRKDRVKNHKDKKAIADKIESNGKNRARKSPNQRRNYVRRLKYRRLIIVLREIHKEKGKGAKRTIIVLTKGEREEFVVPIVKRFVTPGTEIQTDENPAYNSLSSSYDHFVVNHSHEYSTIDGINNNQAESYNSRLKRWINGVSHRVMPDYIYDYACEIAWREDMRRKTEKERFMDVLKKAFKSGPSIFWKGYFQGFRRNDEMLMRLN